MTCLILDKSAMVCNALFIMLHSAITRSLYGEVDDLGGGSRLPSPEQRYVYRMANKGRFRRPSGTSALPQGECRRVVRQEQERQMKRLAGKGSERIPDTQKNRERSNLCRPVSYMATRSALCSTSLSSVVKSDSRFSARNLLAAIPGFRNVHCAEEYPHVFADDDGQ